MNEVIEVFRNHGLNIEHGASRVEIASALMEVGEEELWPIFDDMTTTDSSVGFSADDRIRKTALVYALADACETGIKVINQELVDKALEKATSLCISLFGKRESAPKTTVEADSTTVSPAKRKRNPRLYPKMLQYVTENPDAAKSDVVSDFAKMFPETAVTTLTQYYHKARSEAGLKPNGKPGRQKSDTYPMIKAIVEKMMEADPSVTVKTIKEAVKEQYPHIKDSSAQVYVYKARKELTQKGE